MKHFRDFDNKLQEYLTNKDKALQIQIKYMLNRTQSMFEYSNLPETIPSDIMELYLQTNGNAFVTEHNKKLYVFNGSYSGEVDEYYRNKYYTVTNPALNISKNYEIDKDGIIIKNDTMEIGLVPLLSRYCTLLVENAISLRNASINARAISLISAPDERTKQSAEIYQQKIINGEYAIVGENPFFSGIKMQTSITGGRVISELIALHQYIKASMFNELGLDANYNMKKESISTNEAELSDDFLLPFIDNMIKCRNIAIQQINKKYNTDISIKFASTWLTNEMENEKQKEIYQLENSCQQENLDVEKNFVKDMHSKELEVNQDESVPKI